MLGVEKQRGDQCGWSGVDEDRVLGDGSGGSREPDVRPSTGVAQLLKQVHVNVLTPLMLFPHSPLLPCRAMKRKNREDKSTAKI